MLHRRNFPSLCSRLRVYAVDWLGTGLSGRPSYQARTRQEAEAFFLDSLEQWRKSVGMEGKMILASSILCVRVHMHGASGAGVAANVGRPTCSRDVREGTVHLIIRSRGCQLDTVWPM